MKITDFNDFTELEDCNKIMVDAEKSSITNSTITFNGKNNIVAVEDGVKILNSKIIFNGDNSLLYLSRSRHNYLLDLTLNTQSVVYFGSDNYINDSITAVTSEGHNIVIGNDGLFSYGICIRVSDAHVIYSIETKTRLNPSASVFIGDHVWVGQNAMIFKGTNVGSGAIIGAGSVTVSKKIESNTSYAGNPARKIKSGVFFEKPCVHRWSQAETDKNNKCDSDAHIFGDGEIKRIDIETLDRALLNKADSSQKLEIVKTFLVSDRSKNRFYLPEDKKSFKKKGLFKR